MMSYHVTSCSVGCRKDILRLTRVHYPHFGSGAEAGFAHAHR